MRSMVAQSSLSTAKQKQNQAAGIMTGTFTVPLTGATRLINFENSINQSALPAINQLGRALLIFLSISSSTKKHIFSPISLRFMEKRTKENNKIVTLFLSMFY